MTSSSLKRLRTLGRTHAATGFRSKSEIEVCKSASLLIGDEGKDYYEKVALPFSYEISKLYTPDFIVPRKAMVLEVKGYFPSSDRTKMLLVKQYFPKLDIRFVFDTPNKTISKGSRTTYAKWAEKNGFPWCSTANFPTKDWIEHEPSVEQRKAFDEAIKISKHR